MSAPDKRCQHQRSARQGGCIAKGGDGYVDPGPLCGEGGQLSGDDDSRGILGLNLIVAPGAAADVHPHAVEHGLNGLARERGRAKTISRAVQTDDQAVADKLVGSDILDDGDVLYARRRCLRGTQDRKENRNQQPPDHQSARKLPSD